MTTFTFKEKNSNQMGILVQSIPTITKPKRRVDLTTVDGLDGNIVTEKGYDAYYKEISIGVKDAKRIDEIAAWLDGPGQLILSNEPDKYYIANVVDEVNYESLLRFKQASVKFLCQPFKYFVENKEIECIGNKTIMNKGTIIARPTITIYGVGSCSVMINNNVACTITEIGDNITIDSEKQECRHDDALKNRQMSGEFPILNVGNNTINITGDRVLKYKVSVNARCL